MTRNAYYARFCKWLETIWYKDPFLGVFLNPLGFMFSDLVRFRTFLYRRGILKTHRLTVPVIVVGNITVGGTGKTPLVIWLAKWLKDNGANPGIISRGYGGQTKDWPQTVDKDSDAIMVGDEALLLARQTGCPVVVGPKRVDAARQLLQEFTCNVILSDDGLQHYALHRDLEIVVIDGERRFGNGYCLPAGPLREPVSRLQHVDLMVVNGEKYEDNEHVMHLVGDTAVNLLTSERKSLAEFKDKNCHALAGIGNPQRFFTLLVNAGLQCKTVSFPDHYAFAADDIMFADDWPVLMTEKDAVKCAAFADQRHWFVPVFAQLQPEFVDKLRAYWQKLAAITQKDYQ